MFKKFEEVFDSVIIVCRVFLGFRLARQLGGPMEEKPID